MTASNLEKRISQLERKAEPADEEDEDTFLAILTDDELRALMRVNEMKRNGASEEEAQAWLDEAVPDICHKWKLAQDYMNGARLDEYDKLYQVAQNPWNYRFHGPKSGDQKA